MLFDFLKYINPTWYFNLIPEDQSISYIIDYRKLNKKERDLITIDDEYKTLEGKLADAAYQAWQKGIIKSDSGLSIYSSGVISRSSIYRTINLFSDCNINVSDEPIVSNVNDNYRFIRRFFHPSISWYIFFVRLLSFHNPMREIPALIRSLKISKIELYSRNAFRLYKDHYNEFDSRLIRNNPKVSVIIPTLNRYQYLKDVLLDLERQTYRNFEVIVCDQSDLFDEAFYNSWQLDIKLLRQEKRALWLARNTSIRNATGEYILLFDDDSRVKPDWIIQHLKCLDYFKADISAGVSLSVVGSKIPDNYSLFRWGDQVDTGNVMFHKSLMRITGLFDCQFEGQRQGDGEFGLRCYLFGLLNISNPLAERIHLKVSDGGLRQMGSWDGFRPKKLFAPRPIPSVLYFSRKYFGNHLSWLMLLFYVPGSIIPYKFKSIKWLKALSGFLLLFVWPLILIQVIISWHKAGIKLKEGAKIECF